MHRAVLLQVIFRVLLHQPFVRFCLNGHLLFRHSCSRSNVPCAVGFMGVFIILMLVLRTVVGNVMYPPGCIAISSQWLLRSGAWHAGSLHVFVTQQYSVVHHSTWQCETRIGSTSQSREVHVLISPITVSTGQKNVRHSTP